MSLFADHPKEPQTLGTAHYKDAWVRIGAVLCTASTLDVKTMEVDIDKAAALFRQLWDGAAASVVHESHKVFCKRHYSNFMETGSIADLHRSGRPTDIDAAAAIRAAEILKGGHWREVKVKGAPGRTEDRLFYYTTFAEAVEHDAELKEIVEVYQCSDRKWLERMHAVDPDLTRVSLFSHHEFSVLELAARMAYGSHMLGLLIREPSLLHLLVFCDESTFVLHGLSKHHVQVYCSKTAVRPSDVCYISDLACKPIQTHFFLAVTAHPAFQPSGRVLYDECTGTTSIDRHTNKKWDGSVKAGNQEYLVRSGGLGFSTSRCVCYHSCQCQSTCQAAYLALLSHSTSHSPSALCIV